MTVKLLTTQGISENLTIKGNEYPNEIGYINASWEEPIKQKVVTSCKVTKGAVFDFYKHKLSLGTPFKFKHISYGFAKCLRDKKSKFRERRIFSGFYRHNGLSRYAHKFR